MRLMFLFVVSSLFFGCASKQNMPQAKYTLAEKIAKANSAYDEARLDLAESLYLDITKVNPRYIEAWLKLGSIYVREMRLKAAIRCFEESIKIDSKDGRAWYNLALVRVRQATKTLETAEQIVPLDSKYQPYFIVLHKRLITKPIKE